MAMSTSVQRLVERLRTGDDSALAELTPTLYNELRHIASCHMRGERSDHTLQPTALVHEAYLKLFDGAERRFADELHFLAVASRVMRQVLLDHARGRASLKRSAIPASGARRTTSLEVKSGEALELVDLIELDRAMQELAAENETLAKMIEMHYFGGLTAEQMAEATGRSVHVVRHDMRYAQAWLRRKLSR
jgi:RNA polymerase sigma-70 factor, ECF subfamily